MTDRPRSWLGRADVALDEARILLDHGRVSGCLNRAYYATCYSARAALPGVHEQPKSHSGTHAQFALHFVTTGRISKEIAVLLVQSFRRRQIADYDAITLTERLFGEAKGASTAPPRGAASAASGGRFASAAPKPPPRPTAGPPRGGGLSVPQTVSDTDAAADALADAEAFVAAVRPLVAASDS